MIDSPVNFDYKKIETKKIIEHRNFLPHEIKESEEWSWKRAKYEKWFVQLDCITGKFKRWKLKV